MEHWLDFISSLPCYGAVGLAKNGLYGEGFKQVNKTGKGAKKGGHKRGGIGKCLKENIIKINL